MASVLPMVLAGGCQVGTLNEGSQAIPDEKLEPPRGSQQRELDKGRILRIWGDIWRGMWVNPTFAGVVVVFLSVFFFLLF